MARSPIYFAPLSQAMSIVDRIIKQLQDCTGLFQTQSGLLQPDQLAAIVQSLATSLKSQMSLERPPSPK